MGDITKFTIEELKASMKNDQHLFSRAKSDYHGFKHGMRWLLKHWCKRIVEDKEEDVLKGILSRYNDDQVIDILRAVSVTFDLHYNKEWKKDE